VPVSDPADRLYGENDRGRISAVLVVPLRICLPDLGKLILGEKAPLLMADAVRVDP